VTWIGVARGCSGCTCTPRVKKKIFRHNLQGKFVSASQGKRKSQFLGHFLDLEVEVVDLAVLDRCLRAMRKKRSSTFFRKKSAPPSPDKIQAMPMVPYVVR